MIDYNYLIVRDEGSEITEFRPALIPTTIPVLSSIEGPNSSGKSTLLDLIGICFNGYKSKSINKSLVRKMDNMLDTKYQDLEFDIKIHSKSESLRFIKDRGKLNIDRFRIIGNKREYIDVDSEYELIYDIPINPVERLRELTKEIKIEQEDTEAKLRGFQNYVRSELNKAKNARDPILIKKKENDIIKIKDAIEENTTKLEMLNEDINEKRKIYYVYHYNRLIGKKIDKNFHHKKKSEAQKFEQRKLKKEYQSLSALVSKYTDDLINNHDEISELLKKLDGTTNRHVNLWKYVEPEKIFSQGLVNQTCIDAISEIETELRKQNDSNAVIIEEYNMLKELHDLLQKFVEKDLNLSNEITAKDLLKPLKKRIDTQKKTVQTKKQLERALEVLREIKRDLSFVETDKFIRFIELKNKTDEIFYFEDDNSKDDSIDDSIDNWKAKAIKYSINVDYHEVIKQCAHKVNNNQELKILVNRSETDFEAYISSLESSVKKTINDIEKNRGYLSGLSNELEELKNREESKYSGFKDEIEHLINNMGDLINIFQLYKEFTDSLYNNRSIDSEQFEKYSNSLGNYLANRLGSILHIDKEYKLKAVDIRNNTFESIDGKLIRWIGYTR